MFFAVAATRTAVIRRERNVRRASRIALQTAALLLVLRVSLGAFLAAITFFSREASVLVVIDLPTLATYWVLQQVGSPHPIVDAFDVRFFIIGVVTWSILGYFFGLVLGLLLGRPAATARGSDNATTSSELDV